MRIGAVGVVVAAAAALVIGGSAGCSSGPPAKLARGALRPGTAQLTVNGTDAGTPGAVQCAAVDSFTTIKTGNDSSGATAMVSSAEKLTVEFVRIRNLNGFNGDYNRGLGGDAAVALTDATYHITGTAFGFSPTSLAPVTEPFTMEVAC